MTGQIIVLGWDALDGALIERYGLGEQFGEFASIETITNPHVGEPHTMELWPTLITGERPTEHGIRAATGEGGVDWDSPVISLAADLAAGVVPQRLRTEIGRVLRERGAGLDSKRAAEFKARGLRTVFDGGGRAISIPNYETPYDRSHGLNGCRNDVWEIIVPDRSVKNGIEPQVGLGTVWETILGAAGDRLGHTLAAIEQGHDLVWTWFGLLDTIGHIQPAMDAALEQRGYGLAASMTALVREVAPDDAIVLALSDHGLQCGSHTDYATLATEHAPARDAIDSVVDVAGWVEQARSGEAAGSGAAFGDGSDEMQDQLEALGYV